MDYSSVFRPLREEWRARCLSTAPADREAAEAGIRMVYRAAGLPDPELILWHDSPAASLPHVALLMARRMQHPPKSFIGTAVWQEIIEAIRVFVPALVSERTGKSWVAWEIDTLPWVESPLQRLFPFRYTKEMVSAYCYRYNMIGPVTRSPRGFSSALRRIVLDPMWVTLGWHRPLAGNWGFSWDAELPSLEAAVRECIRFRLSDEAWDRAWEKVTESIESEAFRWCIGLDDPDWLIALDARVRLGMDVPPVSEGHLLAARSCGEWWPCGSIVICTERPCRLEIENQEHLHSETGMALEYPDGWGLWRLHGVRADERIVMHPESFTPAEILEEPNAERRRLILDRYGADRFIRELGARPVDKDEYGTLYRVELPDDEPLAMVHVVNSTAEPDGSYREFFIRVPPRIQTARTAVAWTFGMAADEYCPVVET